MKAKVMHRTYLREATLTLLKARFIVRFLPTRWLLARASYPPRRINRFAVDQIPWVSWAVETASSRRWMKTSCLPRALTVQTMLRRRGIPSKLCLGVAHGTPELAAHAWVEIGTDTIIGDADASNFIRLAAFGGGQQA
jgi:Transglutaminase-like superfamily